ncbi:MAG: TetR family transcriptional regulator [Alphaproteobacteria bacterium]|jgi:AcrR family transcriptional regulator|nr:TetR family transcriptional regulator [Alphaproteobacteria bacterium]
MHQSFIADHDENEPLIAATIRIAALHGASALSSRTIGEFAGVAPSAINYRYGSLEGLISQAGLVADLTREAAWQSRAARLDALSLRPEDFGPGVYSALRDHVVNCRGEEILFWNEVIAGCRAARGPASANGFEAEDVFWGKLLEGCGITRLPPQVMQCFALAVRFAWMIFETPEASDAWAFALVTRFADRALGNSPASGGDSAWRRHAEAQAGLENAPTIPDHDTARRVIKATTDLIMSQGVASVTHRSVAARAGLSASSVQHFFGSRQTLLLAAYRAIYSSARERTLRNELPVGTLEADRLFGEITSQNHADTRENAAAFAAMHGLILSASQSDEMRPIAQALIARMGEASMDILGALKRPRGTISRLDAQILSMTLGQSVVRNLFLQPRSGTTGTDFSMEAHGTAIIRALFV